MVKAAVVVTVTVTAATTLVNNHACVHDEPLVVRTGRLIVLDVRHLARSDLVGVRVDDVILVDLVLHHGVEMEETRLRVDDPLPRSRILVATVVLGFENRRWKKFGSWWPGGHRME